MATTHGEATSFIKTLPAPFCVTQKYADFVSQRKTAYTVTAST